VPFLFRRFNMPTAVALSIIDSAGRSGPSACRGYGSESQHPCEEEVVRCPQQMTNYRVSCIRGWNGKAPYEPAHPFDWRTRPAMVTNGADNISYNAATRDILALFGGIIQRRRAFAVRSYSTSRRYLLHRLQDHREVAPASTCDDSSDERSAIHSMDGEHIRHTLNFHRKVGIRRYCR